MSKQYTVAVRKWFGGYDDIVVEANDRNDAVVRAREYIEKNYQKDRYDLRDIRCIKKNKPQKTK